MTIGGRLKDERARLRMSQTDLASAAGVSKNTQLNYEKDERNPDAGYLIAVASLGIDVNFVLFGKQTPTALDSLSDDEVELLRYFRGMSSYSRETLLRVSYAMAFTDPGIPAKG